MPPIAAPSAHFTLKLFGPFRLSAGGVEIALRGRKACALLAYLALLPAHRTIREHVADLLWTDRGSDQARASLRQTLAELRSVAGMASALQIGRSEIALSDGAIETDLFLLLAAADRNDLVSLAEALTAIDGDLLEAFADVASRFDEWVVVERAAGTEELVARSLTSVERQGMTQPKEAQAILRALDRLDPFNEGVARLGMRLDHAAGDSAALHRRYRRLVDQLHGEFDATPAEATRILFQQLAKGRHLADEPVVRAPDPIEERSGFADELMPAVIVAPLQLVGVPALTSEQADFCSDDMRVAISAMNGIKVFAADTSDIADILAGSGESLGLYLLSGKVRDPGRGGIATLQLANARTKAILWSQSIVLTGIADPIDTIVAKAVGALQPAIDRDLDAAMRAADPEFDDERGRYARARLLIRSAATLDETLAAVDMLERIVDHNPRHLGSRLLLVQMYNTDFWQQMTGHDVEALRQRAASHLEIAAGIAPERVDVRVRRAWVSLRQGSYASASRDFSAVLGERQLDPDIVNQCAFGLCHLGELDKASKTMQRAFELNPFAPSDYHADYAVIQALAGRAAEAEEHFLVSGESGLQYDAVRIANFAALAEIPVAAAHVQTRFARKFMGAWQAALPPQPRDVIAWIGRTMPLQGPAHREFVTRGLEQLLPTFWPAS